MSHDELDDLKERVSRIKKSRTRKEVAQVDLENQDTDTIKRVKSAIVSILEAFTAEDRALDVQSSDARSFYISYGYRHICRLSISAFSEDAIQVNLDSDFSHLQVYCGGFDKKEIQKSVKDALLDWYTYLL